MSQRYETEQWIAVPLARVFAFFADPHNLPLIMPPSRGAQLEKLNLVPPPLSSDERAVTAGRMAGVGTEITLKFRAIPGVAIHERWTALITQFSFNEYFQDVQKQGPFHRWRHTHSFAAQTVKGREGTLIRDIVEFEVGFGVIGVFLEKVVFQRVIRNMFDYRKRALERIFESNE